MKWRYSFDKSDGFSFAAGPGNITYIALSIDENPLNSYRSGKHLKVRIGGEIPVSVETQQHLTEEPCPGELIVDATSRPNPFNPSTTISFTLKRESHMTADIYNLYGQKVAGLIDDVRSAGKQQITWNASGFASGIYFYRLNAGGEIISGKMLFVK